MNERRTLTEGIQPKASPTSQDAEQQFVFGDKHVPEQGRLHVSTRIRADYARALKRAALQRQIDGVTPNTLKDILEEALRPWLKKHGYL